MFDGDYSVTKAMQRINDEGENVVTRVRNPWTHQVVAILDEDYFNKLLAERKHLREKVEELSARMRRTSEDSD